MIAFINEGEAVWNPHRVEYWTRVPQYEQLCYYTFEDIRASAGKGCTLCSKIQEWSQEHNSHGEHKGLDFTAEPNASAAGAWKLRFGVSDGDGEKLFNDDPSSLLTFVCCPLPQASMETIGDDLDRLSLSFSDQQSSPRNTGSLNSLRLADKWIQHCVKNHPTCSADRDDTIYPPRLLSLNGSKVHLILDTEILRGTPYAALSHSWGPNPQQLILTTENQFGLADEIDMASLPPTFRDAIAATRALGLEYLWIDSLCIIQAGGDHAKDWLGHSAIMGSIYQNCTINIAAAHGHDASAGCFVDREVAEVAPCVMHLRKVTKIGDAAEDDLTVLRETETVPYILVPEPLLSQNVGHFHLDTRAWVCQERLLSPRTVYFSKTQLFWECSELHNACETAPCGISPRVLPKFDEFTYMGEAIGQDFSWGTMRFDENIPPFSWRAPSADDQYKWWLKTLHGYVQRNLTKSSDKLPAIGGIAERTARVLNDDYLAGLFRKRLPDALLWSCAQERRPRHARSRDEFYGPSWSWASLNGQLDFTPLAEEKARTLCTVVDASIELVDDTNPYGQVKSAQLTVQAPFATFDRQILDSDDTWVYHFAQLKLGGFAGKKQLLYFDFDPCTLHCAELGLLVVRENARPYTYPGSGDMEEAGLILAPSEGPGYDQYIRVGVWKGIEYDFDELVRHKYTNIIEIRLV
jgi:hypothetical protein